MVYTQLGLGRAAECTGRRGVDVHRPIRDRSIGDAGLPDAQRPGGRTGELDDESGPAHLFVVARVRQTAIPRLLDGRGVRNARHAWRGRLTAAVSRVDSAVDVRLDA